MLLAVIILIISSAAGLALFSFIEPVTMAFYEQKTGIPFDENKTLEHRNKFE